MADWLREIQPVCAATGIGNRTGKHRSSPQKIGKFEVEVGN
jgi:hypothetical protein